MISEDEKSSVGPFKRVTSVYTKKLFGLYDHKVDLFLNDRVTIIHGPNGVGKTTLLKIIHAIFNSDFALLFSVPFEEIGVTLDDNSVIVLRRRQDSISRTNKPTGQPKGAIDFAFSNPDGLFDGTFSLVADKLKFDEWASQYESGVPWIHRMAPDKWMDQRTDQVLTSFELWNLQANETGNRSLPSLIAQVPDEFKRITDSVSTYLVEAQRLVKLSQRRRWSPYESVHVTSAVNHDALDLAARIKDSFTQYGRISQRLDQTFPQRLFQSTLPTLPREKIAESIKVLESERKRLKTAGILEENLPYPFDVSQIDDKDAAKIAAMSLYVKDSEEKLRVLNELASRVESLINNINGKFSNKKIQLDKERGLVARIPGGEDLKMDQLSSGEQHEIVLLYNLLFKIAPNTLVLIDEPELSLHIAWQRKFLPELLEITSSAGIDALVATHSPSIIGDRDDLMAPLDAERDDLMNSFSAAL